MAAKTLVDRGIDVLMLDAGRRAPPGLVIKAAGNTLYRRTHQPAMSSDRLSAASADSVEWYSSLSLGGLSNFWTAAVPRFCPEDFLEGGRLDARYRWPITYQDLEPSYEAAERVLQITAGDPIENAPPNLRRYTRAMPADWLNLRRRGGAAWSHVGVLPMAKGAPWMVRRRGTEFSSYHCLIEPMLKSPRFELRNESFVDRLGWDPRSSRVSTVEYVHSTTGERHSTAVRAVVLAAGVIDSTAIMLRSRSSDFPDGLGNSGGLVGRYLHDHPRQWWVAHPHVPLSALAHPIYIARGSYESSLPLMGTSLTLGLVSTTDRLRTFVRGRSKRFGVQVFGTMVPRPDVGVTVPIDSTGDPRACRPTIHLEYSAAELDNLASARDRLHDLFVAAGAGVSTPGPFHAFKPGSSVHFGGALRMHADARFGVLDAWNRVRDAPNVIVCDSSCFTTGPEKNPTLTAMAIAARAADCLAAELA
jgi:choline dehydrogenase-like flavoprotein